MKWHRAWTWHLGCGREVEKQPAAGNARKWQQFNKTNSSTKIGLTLQPCMQECGHVYTVRNIWQWLTHVAFWNIYYQVIIYEMICVHLFYIWNLDYGSKDICFQKLSAVSQLKFFLVQCTEHDFFNENFTCFTGAGFTLNPPLLTRLLGWTQMAYSPIHCCPAVIYYSWVLCHHPLCWHHQGASCLFQS